MTRLGRWLGLPAVLLGLALGWIAIDQRASWQALLAPAPPVVIELDGTRHRLPADRLTGLAEFSREHFAAADAASRARIRAALDGELDALFLDLEAQLPAFADWYYGLFAEYFRLGHSLLDWIGLEGGDYLARQARVRIFDAAGFDQRLAALRLDGLTRLDTESRAATASWASALISRLEAYPDAQATASLADAGRTIDLDPTLKRLSGLDDPRFDQRFTLSGAAGLTAAPLALRLAAPRAARLAAQGAGRGLLARGGGRVGGAALGATALCAPSGPIAIGCGVAVGLGTWMLVDYGLLTLDEWQNREQLIDDWRASLAEAHASLRQELHQRLDQAVDQRFDAMQSEIQRSFVPVERIDFDGTGQR